MGTLKMIALAIHIVAGTIALISGAINMIGRKGGIRHRKAGKVFAISMYAVALSSLILSLVIESLFFFCLGIFTFYMTWNGQRAAKYRTVHLRPFDLAVLLIGLINTAVMLFKGSPILIGLGILSAVLVIGEIRIFVRLRNGWIAPGNAWLRRHIGMIIGSYIATCTAFLVVNSSGGPWPAWFPWALPSMIGVPMIVYWSVKLSKADRRRSDQRAAAPSRSSRRMPSSL